MTTSIYQSSYKNISAVTLESSYLLAQFLPGHGGKMASLICKKTGREFLVQDPGPVYKTLPYAGNYGEAECSGFDDMFPTIDQMTYTSYPWQGVEAPDHGEVCGLGWDWQIEDNSLLMSVHGIRFPYLLQKKISFAHDGKLDLRYKVTNLSEFDLDFLWAAHMMINVEAGGEIILPYPDLAPATCMFSSDPGLGASGSKLDWPLTRRADGRQQRLSLTGAKKEEGNSYKYYFDQAIPAGWCAYQYPSDGTRLEMNFPADKVPYLGVWVNEGSFHHFHNIALEACTGSYDRPDLARQHGQFSVIPAKSDYEWNFDIFVEVPDESGG